MKQKPQPLGEILHIVNGEAICRPEKPFVGKGAKVITLDQKVIGTLSDPFGPTYKPYQPIKLKNPHNKDLVGELVIAQVRIK